MKKELIGSLVYVGFMLALTVGATIAHRLGYIDRDTVQRVVIIPIGLWMAWYGNRLPKAFVRNAGARQVQRVSAWSQVLSGLAFAGLWAFAPMPVAIWGGMAAILAGLAITFGYCLSLPARAKAG
jgi:hypothetical protein